MGRDAVGESSLNVSVGAYDYWTSDDLWVWIEDFTVLSIAEPAPLTTGKREEPGRSRRASSDVSGLESTLALRDRGDGTKVLHLRSARRTGRA